MLLVKLVFNLKRFQFSLFECIWVLVSSAKLANEKTTHLNIFNTGNFSEAAQSRDTTSVVSIGLFADSYVVLFNG